jgi:hypothetical protein
MFATDFLFDTNRLSDFDCIICAFDGNELSVSGGEIEFNSVKSPSKDRYNFYGAQFTNVLVWNFSICKNNCLNDDMYFDQYEESRLAEWLLRTDGYKWLQFDQDGWEDICYHVKFDMMPHQIGGKTVGFDLTATSDCGYGFSQEMRKRFTLNSSTPYELFVTNDINMVSYPRLSIAGNGDFYISNDSDSLQNIKNDCATEFKNATSVITMDSENDYINGIDSPNDFNWYFIRLVNGNNVITTDSTSDLQIDMIYREIRRVIV